MDQEEGPPYDEKHPETYNPKRAKREQDELERQDGTTLRLAGLQHLDPDLRDYNSRERIGERFRAFRQSEEGKEFHRWSSIRDEEQRAERLRVIEEARLKALEEKTRENKAKEVTVTVKIATLDPADPELKGDVKRQDVWRVPDPTRFTRSFTAGDVNYGSDVPFVWRAESVLHYVAGMMHEDVYPKLSGIFGINMAGGVDDETLFYQRPFPPYTQDVPDSTDLIDFRIPGGRKARIEVYFWLDSADPSPEPPEATLRRRKKLDWQVRKRKR